MAGTPHAFSPMLASLVDAPLVDPQFVYEPKYDGIRAIVEIRGRSSGDARTDLRPRVSLWSRLGNEKTKQFPEVAQALERWTKKRKTPLVLDGEIVALDAKGEPAGFQQLQGRIHVGDPSSPSRRSRPSRPSSPSRPGVALIVFDILKDGATDYRDRPWHERRAALENVFGRTGSPTLRISRVVRGDARELQKEALAGGWEGLIAKHASSLYKSGKRTPDWRKLKIVQEQEFVVGGWTDPRQTRSHFGALLLGVYEPSPQHPATSPRLLYVGHTGTGFDEKELARVMKLLKAREIDRCPFSVTPKTNERPHWVRPELVVQIRFTEWTADKKLRHPVYLGLRDDKRSTEVVAERRTENFERRPSNLAEQLSALEDARKDGVLRLPDGETVKVTNLHKVFWPKLKLTKGDLFRYYAEVAPALLPAIADRPLVMKRFPNGVNAPPFYQHRAAEVPAGIRTEVVSVVERRPQIIGGTLKALMYTTQLAAISQDPWFSRVPHVEFADFAALDLDPPEGMPFERVLDVARWIRDELDRLGAVGVPKTSGSDGLHIYVPLPSNTPYEAGMIYCQIVATMVAHRHPKAATLERSVRARGARVYIDCLQNILGKTLASAYSARASDYAGVSTPVTWKEIETGFDRRDFTIKSVPGRVKQLGDLWAALRKSRGVDLARVARLAKPPRG